MSACTLFMLGGCKDSSYKKEIVNQNYEVTSVYSEPDGKKIIGLVGKDGRNLCFNESYSTSNFEIKHENRKDMTFTFDSTTFSNIFGKNRYFTLHLPNGSKIPEVPFEIPVKSDF